ncbi:hypothetical protein PaG_03131 [Moesziomyces aphidis]|uniref:Uncharacterized protein n=1 Tax=Moesziomyces aphidis TaxID=84754 RepID=W3VNY9_MOEAP|nr:hypothetical protein PaG_03131 [Moesziomyces aphidis]
MLMMAVQDEQSKDDWVSEGDARETWADLRWGHAGNGPSATLGCHAFRRASGWRHLLLHDWYNVSSSVRETVLVNVYASGGASLAKHADAGLASFSILAEAVPHSHPEFATQGHGLSQTGGQPLATTSSSSTLAAGTAKPTTLESLTISLAGTEARDPGWLAAAAPTSAELWQTIT